MRSRLLWLVPLSLVAAPSPAWSSPDDALAPLVHLRSECLLGGASRASWVPSAQAEAEARGAPYRLYSLAGPAGEARATGASHGEEPCSEMVLVSLSLPKKSGATVALGAAWNAMPRPVRVEPTSSRVYLDAVRALLQQKGIAQPRPVIEQLLRVDLDGDGKDEVLLVGGSLRKGEQPGGLREAPFVALRRLVGESVQTDVLEGTFAPAAPGAASCEYSIPAILDANGDGRMEILISASCPAEDAWSVQVHELAPGGPRRLDALQCGCGA